MTRLLNLLSCSALFVLTACNTVDDSHNHPNLKTGKQLFEYHCASCHKEDGSGLFLKGIPANKETSLSAYNIVKRIQGNNEGDKREMPAFKHMGYEEASKIARHLLELKGQHTK